MTASADERLRAVQAAIAEREHLLRVRDHLATDLVAERDRVEHLRVTLKYEQEDVVRVSTGLMGFLSTILDGGNTLAKEEQEAYEAEVRLREAIAALELLRTQAAGVDQRLAALVPAALERELHAARAAKQASIVESGAPQAADLQEIAIQLESLDIELVPLEDAVAAGNAALAVLAELIAALDAAASSGLTSKSAARGIAGEAQSRLQIFRRALSELATSSLDQPLAPPLPPDEFADAWVRALFGSGPAPARLAAARSAMVGRLEAVQTRFAALRARRAELAARRAALIQQRDAMLAT
ncbi:MAG: hypothetical protein M3680_20840 [Myxococcota bacterium]|nr:hypothetical protein [Myxococcota bacterium]